MENNIDIPKKEDRGVNKVAKIPVKVIQATRPLNQNGLR